MPHLQGRQDFWQQIRRQRRNDAELQSAGENAAAVTGEIDEIAGCGEYPPPSPGDLNTDFGQRHLAGPPLDQVDL
jgi:hypothetical protein